MVRRPTVTLAAVVHGVDDLLRRAGTKAISDNPIRVHWKRCLKAIWTLWVPFFKDPTVRLKAWALLLGTVGLISLEVWGKWKISEQTKAITDAMTDAMQDRQKETFWKNLWVLACITIGIGPCVFLQHVLAGTLALEWRRYLTNRLLAKYINSDQAFYKMRMQDVDIDNPDQRIAQDVSEFTEMTAFLLQRLIRDLGTMSVSTLTLYELTKKSWKSSWMMFGGSVICAFIMLQVFSPPLMRVQRRLLGLEADLRYILMRLRENAESIAFFQGAHLEKEQSEFFLARAIRARYTNLFIESGYSCLLGMIQHVGTASSYFYLAPLYFNKTITFSQWTQAQMLASQIHSSVIDFAKNVDKIASLGAQGVRIMEIQEACERYGKGARHRYLRGVSDMDDASTSPGESSDEEHGEDNKFVDGDSDSDDDSDEGGVRVLSVAHDARERLLVSDLTLLPPAGAFPLVKHLSFTMYEEDSVLLTGPSGAGKSTLLRMIGGLYTRGSGIIHRTALKRTFFVPQNPYLYEGSLRDNVMYPQSTAVTPVDMVVQESRIISILETLGIGYLVDRHGLDAGVEFDKMLSGGEKQRLNFARILVRDPGDLAFVLLDEATSALDERNEDIVYDLLRQSVPCYISVGHRINLKKFHTKRLVLEIAAEGGCTGRLTDCVGVGAA